MRAGRLHECLGQREEAIAHDQRFVERWQGGDRPPVWHKAKRDLERLLAEPTVMRGKDGP